MKDTIIKILLWLLGVAFCMVSAAPAVGGASGVIHTSLRYPMSATVSNLPTAVAQPKIDAALVAADLPLPTDYCSTAVYHTNLHRLNHSAPLVTYDQATAVSASQNIINCEANSPEGPVGSNWFGTWSSVGEPIDEAFALTKAFSGWYDGELANYEAASDDFTADPDFTTFASWGHFSQMVWQEETVIGCWSVKCDNTTSYTQNIKGGALWAVQVVCASSPAGNLNGPDNYAANIKGPLGQPPSDYDIRSNNPC